MSLISFLKEFGEAFEDIKKEQEKQEAAMKMARASRARGRRR